MTNPRTRVWPSLAPYALTIVALYAGVLPIARHDLRTLAPSGHDWIHLSFVGAYVLAYVFLVGLLASALVIHWLVRRLHRPFRWSLLGASLAFAVITSLAAQRVYRNHALAEVARIDHDETRRRDARGKDAAEAAATDLAIRWAIVRDEAAGEPPRFDAELTSKRALDVVDIDVDGKADSGDAPIVSGVRRTTAAVSLLPGEAHPFSLRLTREPPEGIVWRIRVDLLVGGQHAQVEWSEPSWGTAEPNATRRDLPPAGL